MLRTEETNNLKINKTKDSIFQRSLDMFLEWQFYVCLDERKLQPE